MDKITEGDLTNKPDPTIGQIRNARQKCQYNILREVMAFTTATGVQVNSINLIVEKTLLDNNFYVDVILDTEI
jgi:hypothetical protein